MLNISSTDCRDPERWTTFTLIVVCLLIVSVKTQTLGNRKLFMPVMSLSTTSVVDSKWISILKTFSLMTPLQCIIQETSAVSHLQISCFNIGVSSCCGLPSSSRLGECPQVCMAVNEA